jgi:hypothetical protein
MPKAASLESFEKELSRLVGKFEYSLAELKAPGYVEAQLRDDFLNPFFRLLGWDLENSAGLIQTRREVEIESRTEIGGGQKRADYLFRADGHDRFICEAKKPAEELHSRHAFQAKRYAWNKGVPIAILTDFEEFKIYLVGGRPYMEEPLAGLWKSWHFRELAPAAREIWNLFARDNVASGSIDRLIESLPKTPVGKGKARQQWLLKPDRSRSIDVEFLNFLDEARRELGFDLIRNNDRADLLGDNKLNEAVQRIIDRLLFLRICEDRDIDTGVLLNSIVHTWGRNYDKEDVVRAHQKPLELREEPPVGSGSTGLRAPRDSLWRAVVRHFRALDRRPPSHVPFFNGNLFKHHFSEELVLGDGWLVGFISDLSDEESPYLFSYIPVEILGTIYERFLGKIVRPQGRGVTIEEKPEVRKAGGVYYTPRYIVEYIVAQTVESLLHAAKPEATLKLHFLDPACGSGSFLIRVFEVLCEHWEKWFKANPKERKKKWCWADEKTGDVHLTMALKRRILTSSVYGVDLDPGAVEVTQLSLYLKMLENENRNTLQRQRELLPEDDDPLLPPLENSIQCGNSLIASDFSIIPEDLVRVHAFDWNVGFKDIMKDGGFDAVVGNPPYNLLQPQNVSKQELDYYHQKFTGAQYKVDIYHLFIEQSLRLLRSSGLISLITPAPFTTNNYTTNLRSLILGNVRIRQLVTVADGVFEQASVDNVIFAFQKCDDTNDRAKNEIDFLEAEGGKTRLQIRERYPVLQSVFQDTPGMIFRPPKSSGFGKLEAKFWQVSKPLGDLARVNFGMQLRDRTKHPGDVVETTTPKTLKATYKACLTGKNIHRYFTEFADLYCLFDRVAQQGGCWDEEIQFARNKIIVRQIGEKPIASFDGRGYCCLNTVFMVKATVSGIDERYLLGVLNSRAIGFYWENKFSDFKKTFPKIKGSYLQQLPIPTPDKARHDKLVGLVNKMLALMPKLREAKSDSEKGTLQNAAKATEQQIDAVVYGLYGLNEKEIQLVESNT